MSQENIVFEKGIKLPYEERYQWPEYGGIWSWKSLDGLSKSFGIDPSLLSHFRFLFAKCSDEGYLVKNVGYTIIIAESNGLLYAFIQDENYNYDRLRTYNLIQGMKEISLDELDSILSNPVPPDNLAVFMSGDAWKALADEAAPIITDLKHGKAFQVF